MGQQDEPNYDNMKKFVNSKHGIPAKIHDSWSSRASSILKDPQSIYVSREEVLANLKADILRAAPPPKDPPPAILPQQEKQLFVAPSANPASHSKTRLQQVRRRIHDSWSSRASSIMANGITEPNYMSRSEMLTKISSGIPGQTRQELEDLTKYIHEVDLEDQTLNQFNFGENADQRTESS